MIVTIHQPNFVPWYPFFQKIEQADVFVVLGYCQFEKNGFQNRFQLDQVWHTLSVYKGLVPIREKKYVNPKKDWENIKSQLPLYKDVLSEMDYCVTDNVFDMNFSIIKHLVNRLEIKTKIEQDYQTDLRSTERLVDICKKYGATTYLAGQGGLDYLDESLFKKENIEVIYQKDLNRIHTLQYIKNEASGI